MKIKADKSRMVAAILGLLGATIPLVIGFYLVSTMENLASYQNETSQIWITVSTTAIASIATFFGSYLILNSKPRKGGALNIAGGVILLATYSYFSEFSKPNLLEWLNPLGLVLVIPPFFSGVTSLINSKSERLAAAD